MKLTVQSEETWWARLAGAVPTAIKCKATGKRAEAKETKKGCPRSLVGIAELIHCALHRADKLLQGLGLGDDSQVVLRQEFLDVGLQVEISQSLPGEVCVCGEK